MIVGLYHPTFWKAHGHWDYLNQTKGKAGLWNGVTYEVNNNNLVEPDFVVVHDDIDCPFRMKTSAGGFILVTGEEKSIKTYHQEYLDQFDLVITSRDDIEHSNVIRSHYFHPWRIKKTYDELSEMNHWDKQKTLSAIISNLTTLPSHKERFALINKLKGHYKTDLDWFSKGENTFIEDKWVGLAPYRYSVAIENSCYDNYFTEKLSDCFLAYTLPFYAGCPNISSFFDDRSFIILDTKDFTKSIEIIDLAVKENIHEKNLKFLKDSRRLILEKYHFIAALTDVLRQQKRQITRTAKTIRPNVYFNNGKIERLVKDSIKKIIGK